MKLTSIYFNRLQRTACVALCAGFAISTYAKPVPDNLGYGLDKLVESNIAIREAAEKGVRLQSQYNGYATQEAANYAQMAIQSEDGRFMIDVTLNGSVPFEQVKEQLEAKYSSLEITQVDAKYHGVGIIEGWVSIDEAADLAKTPGVQAAFLSHKPSLNGAPRLNPEGNVAAKGSEESKAPLAPGQPNINPVGSKFDQGVTQHRVDKINQFYDPNAPVNYDGAGITVGVISDSFNTRNSGSTAATAMATFDLPGAANNPLNTTPVAVLQDFAGDTDEGRGMAEIVYKMAPRAKIGFATGEGGELNFANNIRALAGTFGVPHSLAGFKADVITDDLSYGGEPAFADTGIVMGAVDDVAAAGVAYFSSAANSYGVTVYNSDLRWVANGNGQTAATNAALVGTNINLANVPTNLYQGGFHNFRTDGGQDVACTWTVANGGAATEMQWDDPYDNFPVIIQPPLYTNTGTITTNATITFSDIPPLSAGQKYVISETATSGNFDGIVSIIDPNGVTIIDQDSGTDEQVQFFPPVSGQYKVAVRRFGTTSGNFRLDVNTSSGGMAITTDINMLAFRVDNGAYVPASSLTTNNFANNRPVELGAASGVGGQLQFVIARATVPTAPRPATHIRLGTDANSNSANAPAEYFDYNSAVTVGHSIAAGCNGVGAYDVFRPNVPQNFTSGGPALLYFDRNNNPYPNGPIVRLQPKISAANNANTTWLNGDSPNDFDTGGGQFGGTSAAAPHAAGIAALVLQKHGGTGSVSPAQMTSILQRSTFAHDLDPYTASGTARVSNGGKVTVTVISDQTATAARGRNDPNSHRIAYVGPSSITSFKFNPNGLAAEGGAVTSGQNGLDASNNYFSNVTPGMYFTNVTATGAFAFTQGASTGIATSDASFALSNPAPAPANQTAGVQGQTLTLTFTPGSFAGGDVFRFTIGRGLIRGPQVTTPASATNYNADNFGGGVLIPENTVIPDGMRFSGTMADGSTFDGIMRNRLGFGFSNIDGFGFINAEAAVNAPIQ